MAVPLTPVFRTADVKVLFVSVFVVADKYVSNVSILVCRIVPLSLVTMPSPLAIAVVPTEVLPSTILSSVAVESTAASLVKSACTKPDTPSSKLSSVAVDVTATSSFILGDVRVLFVRVAVEAVETKRASPPVLGSVKVLLALSEWGAAIIVCPCEFASQFNFIAP